MIRQVRTEGWERLRDVRLRALADAPEAFTDTLERSSELPETHWRARATPSETQSSFIREDGEGMVSCFVADNPANVFLVGMWVAPDLRGSGAAQDLVGRVVEWARERGAIQVLLSVDLGNERAARFYENCGFLETRDPPPFPYEIRPANRFYVFEL